MIMKKLVKRQAVRQMEHKQKISFVYANYSLCWAIAKSGSLFWRQSYFIIKSKTGYKAKKVVLTFLKTKTVSPNSMADEVCLDKFELGLNYSMLLYSFSN